MPQADLSQAEWRKSSLSQPNGNCVEVAILDQAVAVRDSKNPSGPALLFPRDEWNAFIKGVTNGKFAG